MRRWGATMLSIAAYGSKQLRESLSLPTVAALAGSVLSVVGLHMVYPPLAYIVPGAALLTGGVWMALPQRRR